MSTDRLIDMLELAPEQFDFFQAVYLLEQHLDERHAGKQTRGEVGTDRAPITVGLFASKRHLPSVFRLPSCQDCSEPTAIVWRSLYHSWG